jgi:hypothetical protein
MLKDKGMHFTENNFYMHLYHVSKSSRSEKLLNHQMLLLE